MSGGLQGNWALILVLYSVLIALAMGAHVVWVWRVVRDVRRSNHGIASKILLTALLIMTPVISFYAIRLVRQLGAPFQCTKLGMRDLVMPATGVAAGLACALHQTMNYSPDFRTWQTMLGFVPGYLALYMIMQLIIFMAASVFGRSERGFLSSPTHLVSALILLANAVFSR